MMGFSCLGCQARLRRLLCIEEFPVIPVRFDYLPPNVRGVLTEYAQCADPE